MLWLRFLCVALLLVQIACGGPPTGGDSGASTEPTSVGDVDILLVTIDTLRHDALGYVGNPDVQTPVLDRLAQGGAWFSNAYAHNVVTLPSHANLLTGRYPYEHGVRDNSGFVLDDSVPTLAALLKEAGFRTVAFVGAYPLDAQFGLDRGFDIYDDRYPTGSASDSFTISERRGDQVVGPALDWWQANRGAQRFLWVHLYDPHAPYHPPEPFASRYQDAPYLGEVAAVDFYLAPLLTPILDGEGERGVVVAVTSDHGEALGEHGEQTHGLFAYESTLKVPLILWGPGIEPAQVTEPVGHVDLMPTLLEAAGLEPESTLPGQSLLAGAGEGRLIYFEALSAFFNRGWAPLRGAIGSGRDKWIELPLPELYDLEADPAELENLFGVERRRTAELRNAMPEEVVWPPVRQAISPEQAARLRSLGYVSGSGTSKTRFTEEDDPKRLVGLDRKIHRLIDLYSTGQLTAAEAVGREVIAERPSMAVGYEHLALVLRQTGRAGEAVEILRRGLGRSGESRSLTRELGLALAEAGEGEEAVKVLGSIASEDDLDTLVALGNAQFTAGQLNEARQTMEQVLNIDSENVRAFEGLGATALAAGRPDIARGYLERALALNPELPIANNSLGVALYQLGQPAEAIAAWERAVQADPNQLDALFNIGLAAAGVGDRPTARHALERFLAGATAEQFAADRARARQLLTEL